ncbi:hypothetical protein Tco_0974851 [Tanacetum coccineum]|uniref:Uncharacterized protein n=1 Tax=Tanacetum coccineum TaxID=301880 RepID=A0ABQ5ECP9_9ASTR
MSTLTFADTHNMVAFLKKPAESDGFHEINDFLNANQIRYALPVNPIIYTSCIQQFWATIKANTVNGERGTDCLPTATIFKELTRIGAKSTAWNEFSSPMASLIICLATNKKFNLSKYIFDAMVLDLEKAKDAQAKEIDDLKKRVQKLERKQKSRTTGLKRLRKVGESRRIEFSKGRSDNEGMFDTNDLHADEINMDMPVEITLVQTLIQIKAAKSKVVTTTATTTTTTRPKARGVVVQEPSEFRTPQESQPLMIKDKGKAIMIEPEVPLKRKDQVALDEDLARNLQAQLEAELIEEERLARKKEEESNIALIESWDNT